MFSEVHQFPANLIKESGVSVVFQLKRVVPVSTSEYVLSRKAGQPLDTRWYIDIQRDQDEPNDWEDFTAFIDRIHGLSGKFTFFNPLREVPQGRATGIGFDQSVEKFTDGTTWSDGTDVFGPGNTTGYIDGSANRGDSSIVINNLVASNYPVLKRGDHLSILHGRLRIPTLYQVLYNTTSNAQGKAEVTISPNLRYNVVSGDEVNFWQPRGVFQLLEDREVEVTYPYYASTRVTAIEYHEVLDEEEEADPYAVQV